MMQGPIHRYDALRASNEFIFVVFFRGSWCPFCRAYLKALQELLPNIVANGGAVVAVTSENESELPKTRAGSGYTGEVIVDTELLLVKELKRRGIIDVAISEHKGYPNGMIQPAILVGSKERVWYHWAIVPSTMNLGGAKDRPLLNEVWDNVHAEMQGKAKVHEKIGLTSFISGFKHLLFG